MVDIVILDSNGDLAYSGDHPNGVNLIPLVPAGSGYRMYRVDDGTDSFSVSALTAGSIDQATPTVGTTLTVTPGNETASATYQWQKGGVDISGATSASFDTTSEGVGDYRRGVTDGVQGPVYTSAVTVGAAATAPSQMGAPTLVVNSATQITATLASDPTDGGSAITSYDLRYSTDESTWTTLTGITSPRAITGLTASTLYYVQARAVNAVGAGAWSASVSDTTSAAPIGAVFIDTYDQPDGTTIVSTGNYTEILGTSGTLRTLDGEVVANGGATAAAFANEVLASDQYVKITVGNVGSGGAIYLRGTDLSNAYRVELKATGSMKIQKVLNDAITPIGSTHYVGAVEGDVVELRAVGTTLTLLLNDVVVASGTDTSFSGGSAGYILNTTDGIDTFECGDVV